MDAERPRSSRYRLIAMLWLMTAGCVQAGDQQLFQTVDAGSAGDGTGGGPCTDPVDFTTQVVPILETSCALSGCHQGPNGALGLVLDGDVAFANIVGVPATGSDKSLVAASDVAGSFLADRIQAANGASIMPPVGDPLAADDVQTVLCWIEQGATEAAADPCAAPVSYAKTIQPIFDTTCALSGCHQGPSGALGLVLDAGVSYDNIVDKAALGSSKKFISPGAPEDSFLFDRVRAANGASIMPPIGDPVPAAQIEQIRCWIKQGAPREEAP